MLLLLVPLLLGRWTCTAERLSPSQYTLLSRPSRREGKTLFVVDAFNSSSSIDGFSKLVIERCPLLLHLLCYPC